MRRLNDADMVNKVRRRNRSMHLAIVFAKA